MRSGVGVDDNIFPFLCLQIIFCMLASLMLVHDVSTLYNPHYHMSSHPSIYILIPKAQDPSGLWQGSRALAKPNFLSMRRVFVLNSQPIRFARFEGKSVNHELPVLDQTSALNPCHRPEGSWALGTRLLPIVLA